MRRIGLEADFFDYDYASRLLGEPAEGISNIHTHPLEPRSLRAAIVKQF